MKKEELMKEVEKNIYKLLDADTIARVLDKSNNLARLDLVNKIYVIILGEGTETDVRTDDEWQIFGRRVKQGSKYLNIVVPRVSKRYVDSETEEIVDISEFSLDEIKIALRKGIMKSREEHIGDIVQRVYDIKNTERICEGADEIDGVDSIELLEKTAKSILANSDAIIYCKDDRSIHDAISKIVDTVISNKSIQDGVMSDIGNNIKLDQEEIVDMIEMIKFSVGTIFSIKEDGMLKSRLLRYKKESMNKLMYLIRIADYYSGAIYQIASYCKGNSNASSEDTIGNASKAQLVYNLIEAFKIRRKLGAV